MTDPRYPPGHPAGDPLQAPLSGRTVVEASAGTGKTYTIVGLYLRLILEARLKVDQVLVMSFTRAATAELKDRIRKGLRDARRLFKAIADGQADGQGVDPEDHVLRRLLELELDPQDAIRRLGAALAGFDEAAVFTIHGFCQRALQDHAFRSGQPFDMELVADENLLLGEVARDFWRHLTDGADQALLDYLCDKKQTPDKALAKVRPYLGQPGLRKISRGKQPESYSDEDANDWHAWLYGELLEWCDAELPERKRRRRVWTYHDLLLAMHKALDGSQGESLAADLRDRYQAALIDEFQDTDPLQYEIFDRIYGDGSCPVFYVGDPKQAIYSFRRADVFAYLDAKQSADNPLCSLSENWRSSPGLIRAVNAIFEGNSNPFLFNRIGFDPVKPQPDAKDGLEGLDTPAMTIWFSAMDQRAEAMRRQVADRVATEIAGLLGRGASINEDGESRLLTGGDIAVLVRNHVQGRAIRKALSGKGINSVQLSQDSVFETDEAEELERVLFAVAEPSSTRRLRVALSTRIAGKTASELEALLSDDAGWDAEFERFQRYNHLWRERGFVPMLSRLLEEYGTSERLTGSEGGERRLTNLFHLSELLHRAAETEGLGMEALIKWFAHRRQQDPREEEDRLLRLESDEQLVKVTTIHTSKGLQYPIVFCPYLWTAAPNLQAPYDFHDPDHGNQPVLHMGHEPREEAKERAKFEAAAEQVRLAYVALTRARYRCYVVWGPMGKQYHHAPLAWLLHADGQGVTDWASFDEVCKAVKGRDAAVLREELETFAAGTEGAIAVVDLGAPTVIGPAQTMEDKAELRARRFDGRIRSGWRMHSYSSLTRGHAAELPDHDAWLTEESAQDMDEVHRRDIFSFPRGARAGQCLHTIMENLSFDAGREAIAGAVAAGLRQYGFDAEWAAVLTDTVERVLNTPLDQSGLKLSDVPDSQRLIELEFTYPVTRLESDSFEALLRKHGEKIRIKRQSGPGGYLKGFVDLIFSHEGRFYIADYKSNWLGSGEGDYAAKQLPAVIQSESYNLQYLLYTLALHRYLTLRQPDYDYDTHFGGVFYLFMRGMNPSLGYEFGVFADRPDWSLVGDMDEYFRGETR